MWEIRHRSGQRICRRQEIGWQSLDNGHSGHQQGANMDTFDDHLTWMESTTGPEFAAAVAPGGVLRAWVVQHLADEMGEDPETAETAVDVWLADHGDDAPIDADRETLRLDDRIETVSYTHLR